MTRPVIVVRAAASHCGCCRHSPVHELLPHCPGVPPPPQITFPEHDPHWSKFPHPSPAGPQVKDCDAQEIGLQRVVPSGPRPLLPPHLLKPPPPQNCGATQAPHISNPPQPSPAYPQS